MTTDLSRLQIRLAFEQRSSPWQSSVKGSKCSVTFKNFHNYSRTVYYNLTFIEINNMRIDNFWLRQKNSLNQENVWKIIQIVNF